MVPTFNRFQTAGEDALRDGCGRVHDYLRIAVTDHCNLRCVYCMPTGNAGRTPSADLLSDREIIRLGRFFAALGVKKIRLTGGEPLLRRGLGTLVSNLAALPGIHTVAITTNGMLLAKNAQLLIDAGLNRVNVSLDTLRQDRFFRIAGHAGLRDVLDGIQTALALGFQPLRVNMVVMGGVNDDELPDFVEFTRHRPVCVRFIEFMPFPGNPWCDARLMPHAAMRRAIESRYPLEHVPAIGSPGVANEFRVPGFTGSLGFITPMTSHFCGDCSRLRITADGSLKTCLFHAPECSLRDAMRNGADDADLADMVRGALLCKPRAHADMSSLAAQGRRSMFQIGG